MRVASRVAVFTILAVVLGAHAAPASVINVAEFNWTSVLVDPSPNCDPAAPDCVPDPLFQSLFQLTNIWDGPDVGPTLQNSRLTLPAQQLLWFDVAAPNDPTGVNFDQIPILDTLPLFAEATIAFTFNAQVYTLSALLTAPDTSEVLSIDVPDTPPAPVPEPGTLGLLAVGAAAAWSRARRITTPRH